MGVSLDAEVHASSVAGRGGLRPFLAVGPSFRTQEDASSVEPSQIGVAVSAGAAFHLGPIRVAPALRYTRWVPESIYPRYPTKPDQIEFLTSVGYQTNSELRRLGGHKLEIGAIAGLSFTRGLRETNYAATIEERMRFLAGITAHVPVMRNVSVEVDAIYKPLRANSRSGDLQFPFSVITWQFPVLAKYSWTKNSWMPFAEAGPSFRLAGNLNGYNPSHYGVTIGGGVETRTHGMRLSPALRYTRWAEDSYRYQIPPGAHFDYPRTNANAFELVFGISF
jgi:hypothetical protein